MQVQILISEVEYQTIQQSLVQLENKLVRLAARSHRSSKHYEPKVRALNALRTRLENSYYKSITRQHYEQYHLPPLLLPEQPQQSEEAEEMI